VEHCQRKLRHTTHHQDLPQKVTVTRVRHPFEGKSLAVWQSIRRKGRMYLVLILPDGSKSMIPAEWTDFGLPEQKSEPVRSAPRRNLPLGNIARAVQAARDRNSGTTHR